MPRHLRPRRRLAEADPTEEFDPKPGTKESSYYHSNNYDAAARRDERRHVRTHPVKGFRWFSSTALRPPESSGGRRPKSSPKRRVSSESTCRAMALRLPQRRAAIASRISLRTSTGGFESSASRRPS